MVNSIKFTFVYIALKTVDIVTKCQMFYRNPNVDQESSLMSKQVVKMAEGKTPWDAMNKKPEKELGK